MDKTIFLTGASKGLGLIILRGLLETQYKVVTISRHLSEELNALIKEYPERVEYQAFDLTDHDKLGLFCKNLFLKHKFYGLINNAGIAHDGLVINNDPVALTKMIKINFISPIFLSRLFSKHFILNREGRIINISSIASSKSYKGLAVYGATKAGIESFTKSLAIEIGSRNITVNAVAPGFIPTPMNNSLSNQQLEIIRKRSALKRLPVAEDISSMILYLLSDKANNITGSTMVIDSGQSL